jgi:hypothetical protein
MNFAQMKVLLRDIITAGGGQNTALTTDDFWSNSELGSYINAGRQQVYQIIRRARSDYFTRIMRTTDPPLLIRGQTYDPSSLRWVANQGNYTLPPDFVRMKMITDLTADNVRLIGSDIAKNSFRVLMNQSGGNTAREFLYDILGIRTIIFRPIPIDARDFEFIYEKNLEIMRDWNTGTVSLTLNSNTATFSAGADIQNRLVVGDELIVGSGPTTQVIPDPNIAYPVIKSIDSSTQVTLESIWLDATVNNYAYTVSTVGEIPLHHQYLHVVMAAVWAFKKGTNPSSDSAAIWQQEADKMIPSLINDVETRQGSDFDTSEPFLEDLYDA